MRTVDYGKFEHENIGDLLSKNLSLKSTLVSHNKYVILQETFYSSSNTLSFHVLGL